MKRKVRKKGRGGGRPSGRNKQEESKLALSGKDMAIRYMNKAKEEKSKADGNTDTFNKLTSTINPKSSADPTSDVQFKHPRELGEGLVNEKTAAVSHNTLSSTIPEVFDSSRYNAMEELKESTNNKMMNESKSKEVISSDLQKEEKPIVEPANLVVDGSNPSLNNIDTSNNNPTFQQEQHELIKTDSNDITFQRLDERELEVTQIESRQDEIMLDHSQNLENNKGFAKVEEDENKKDEENTENKLLQQQPIQHLTNLPRNYIDPWHDFTNAWVDMYTEGVRNAAKVTEYWLDSFYIMGFGQKSNKQKESIKID
jgi:hypothetical protein